MVQQKLTVVVVVEGNVQVYESQWSNSHVNVCNQELRQTWGGKSGVNGVTEVLTIPLLYHLRATKNLRSSRVSYCARRLVIM